MRRRAGYCKIAANSGFRKGQQDEERIDTRTDRELPAGRSSGGRRFVRCRELQTWRTYVDEAVANRQDRKLANGDMKSGDSYYDKVFTQRLNLWADP